MTQLGEKYVSPLSYEEFKKGTFWRDHIVEFPGRFKEIIDTEDPSLVSHEPNEGNIIQQGTPVNARNLGLRDHAIWTLYKMVLDLAGEIPKLQTEIATLTGSSETNGFILSMTDFEIIEGWYDVNNQKVVMK